MEKKFFFKIIGIIVAVVTAMAGIVIWIDPFYHYHKPLSYISYVSGADVYSNRNIYGDEFPKGKGRHYIGGKFAECILSWRRL